MKLLLNEDGQDLVEYALFGGFIALAAAVSIPAVINAVTAAFSSIVNALNTVASSLSTG